MFSLAYDVPIERVETHTRTPRPAVVIDGIREEIGVTAGPIRVSELAQRLGRPLSSVVHAVRKMAFRDELEMVRVANLNWRPGMRCRKTVWAVQRCR